MERLLIVGGLFVVAGLCEIAGGPGPIGPGHPSGYPALRLSIVHRAPRHILRNIHRGFIAA